MISLCVKYYYIEKKMESKTIVEENNFINTGKRWSKEDENYLEEKIIGPRNSQKSVTMDELIHRLKRNQSAIELKIVNVWARNKDKFYEDYKRITPIGNKYLTYEKLEGKSVCPSNVKKAWGVYGDSQKNKSNYIHTIVSQTEDKLGMDKNISAEEKRLEQGIKSDLNTHRQYDEEKENEYSSDYSDSSDESSNETSDESSEDEKENESNTEIGFSPKTGLPILDDNSTKDSFYDVDEQNIWPQTIDMKIHICKILRKKDIMAKEEKQKLERISSLKSDEIKNLKQGSSKYAGLNLNESGLLQIQMILKKVRKNGRRK